MWRIGQGIRLGQGHGRDIGRAFFDSLQGAEQYPGSQRNIYAAAGKNMLSPAVKGQRNLVYVPNHSGGTVTVIDPTTYKVIDTFTSRSAVRSTSCRRTICKTLWVNNDEGGNSLTPIDPYTGKRGGPNVPVHDPYNMYFTPDGKSAIVVAEAEQRLDFRDPHTMALQSTHARATARASTTRTSRPTCQLRRSPPASSAAGW